MKKRYLLIPCFVVIGLGVGIAIAGSQREPKRPPDFPLRHPEGHD